MSKYDIQTIGILIDAFMPVILPVVFVLGLIIGSFGHYLYGEWEYRKYEAQNDL